MNNAELPLASIAAWGLLLLPGMATALDATVDVSNRTEYTDNTALTESNEIGEWINTPAVGLNVNQAGAVFEVDADYTLERRIYQRDLFEDTNAVRGTAEGIWHTLPERLDFTVRNTVTESTINSRIPNTEANRQSISYTEVGPTLRLRPQTNAEFQLEYFYTDVSDDETDTDSKRHNGAARYILELSSLRSLMLEATRQDVDFDNPAAADLDTWIGSVTFSHEGSNVQYSLTGGYNQTGRGLGRDDVNGGIFGATLEWDATENRSVTLTASHEIRDQSSTLLTGGGGFGDEIDEDTDLTEVFTETRGEAGLTQRLGPNEFQLTAIGSQEDYEDIPRDNEYLGARLGYERNVSPLTTLRAALETGKRKYTDEGDDYDELRGSVELSRALTRRFSVALQALYEERESDSTGLDNYDEWVGALTLRYRLVGPPVMSR